MMDWLKNMIFVMLNFVFAIVLVVAIFLIMKEFGMIAFDLGRCK